MGVKLACFRLAEAATDYISERFFDYLNLASFAFDGANAVA